MALRHQPARKMGPPHHLFVSGIAVGAFIRTDDAMLRQIVGHAPGARDAPLADGMQTGGQLSIQWVNAQTHDVDSLAAPSHRNLYARYQNQSQLISRGPCRRQPRDIIVIGQRERVHPVGGCARDHFSGRQHPIRHVGMAMQIDIEHR